MIDRKFRVVVPEGGRMKTGSEQASPLSDRALEILDELKKEKRGGAGGAEVNGLIFTRDDGRPITRSMISDAVQKAVRDARVKKYRFHDYRNTALTDWARRRGNVDIAMRLRDTLRCRCTRGTWICKAKTLRRLSDCYRMVTRTRTRKRSSRK